MAAKIFLGLFAAAATLTLATVGTGAAVVYNAGTLSVEAQAEDGSQVTVSLPAILAHLAIALAPDELIADLHRELEPLWPTIEAAARELDRTPDFVLLEIRSRDEHVVLAKRSGRLLIEVESERERVSIAVPLATMRRIVEKLGDDPGRG